MFHFRRIALAAIVLAAATNGLRAASVTLVAPGGHGPAGAELKAPILVRGAEGLGSFQMELVYDPSLVQPLDVEEGKALGGGMLAFHVTQPGRLRIAVVGDPKTPIDGDGELLLVKFKLLGKAGADGILTFENALAWEQTNNAFDMLVKTETGTIAIDRAAFPMWIPLAGSAGLILAILILVRRGKRTTVPQ